MAGATVLRWLDGRGWLVLSGDDDEDIRAIAINRSSADGGVACVSLSGEGEQLTDQIVELGAPSSYQVDVLTEDDQAVQTKLAEAGVVIVEGGASPDEARSVLRGAAIDGIQEAYQNGAVVLVEGAAAEAFGAWILAHGAAAGLEWVEGAVIMRGGEGVGARALPVFEVQPNAVAIAIEPGSALALGPDGQVETWGRRQVTVALGPAYQT